MEKGSTLKRIIPFTVGEDILLSLWLNYMSKRGYELEKMGYFIGVFRRTKSVNVRYKAVNEKLIGYYITHDWKYTDSFRGHLMIVKRSESLAFLREKKLDYHQISGILLWGSLGLFLALEGLRTLYCSIDSDSVSFFEIDYPIFCASIGSLIWLLGMYLFLKALITVKIIVIMIIGENKSKRVKASKIPSIKRIPVLSILSILFASWYFHVMIIHDKMYFAHNYALSVWVIATAVIYMIWKDYVRMANINNSADISEDIEKDKLLNNKRHIK